MRRSKTPPPGVIARPASPPAGERSAPSRATEIASALGIIAPDLAINDLRAIVDQALSSKGLKTASPQSAAWLSLVAYLRHNFTSYDQLLKDGYQKDEARYFCQKQLVEALMNIGCRSAEKRLNNIHEQD